jgi:hypothetical protein
MKKNAFYLFLTVLFIGISFTSCENDDDDYWLESTLDIKLYPKTDNRDGYFESPYIEYRIADLTDIPYSRVDIKDIRLIDSYLDIYGTFRYNDIIEKLAITVEGVGTYTFPADYAITKLDGIRIDDRTAPGYFKFMQDVIRQLEYGGRIRVLVSGFHNPSNGEIDIVIKNDLDVRVRDL